MNQLEAICRIVLAFIDHDHPGYALAALAMLLLAPPVMALVLKRR